VARTSLRRPFLYRLGVDTEGVFGFDTARGQSHGNNEGGFRVTEGRVCIGFVLGGAHVSETALIMIASPTPSSSPSYDAAILLVATQMVACSCSGEVAMTVRKQFAIICANRKKNSMPLLVFWPLAGAWGAGEILPPCAQLLWCALYVMKDSHKNRKNPA